MFFLQVLSVFFSALLYRWLGAMFDQGLPDGVKLHINTEPPSKFSRFILNPEGQMKSLKERATELLDNIEIFDRELGASIVELQAVMDRSPIELRREIIIRYDSIFYARRDVRLESSLKESLKETYDRFVRTRTVPQQEYDDQKTEVLENVSTFKRR